MQNPEVVHSIKRAFDEPSWGASRSQVMAQSLLVDSDAPFFPPSPSIVSLTTRSSPSAASRASALSTRDHEAHYPGRKSNNNVPVEKIGSSSMSMASTSFENLDYLWPQTEDMQVNDVVSANNTVEKSRTPYFPTALRPQPQDEKKLPFSATSLMSKTRVQEVKYPSISQSFEEQRPHGGHASLGYSGNPVRGGGGGEFSHSQMLNTADFRQSMGMKLPVQDEKGQIGGATTKIVAEKPKVCMHVCMNACLKVSNFTSKHGCYITIRLV